MEVILREDIDKLGQRGDMVKVTAGYARNYLLPRNLAVAANESNKKIVEQQRQAHLRRDAKLVTEAQDLGKMMAAVSVTIHQKAEPAHGTYHLSSGTGAQTYREITDALAQAGRKGRPSYLPSLGKPFSSTVNWASNRGGAMGYGASLLKVFWPYLDWNTVFDNSRVVTELGESPAKFSSYAYPLLQFSRTNKFKYPAKPWPASGTAAFPAAAGGERR